MRLVGEERREFQRLRLDPTVPATLGDVAVSILEIGVLGARVRHADPIGKEYAELRFSHGGVNIGMRCEVVRTINNESGVRFLAAIDDSGDKLRNMLADLVTHEFEVRRKMPPNTIPQNPSSVDGDKTVRGADAAFLCYRLENGVWRRRRVFLPEQPSVGFTVARSEDSAEMQRLCRVYEASDEEGRRLIRLFAELSVSDALEIPPKM
ncbi:MAG TPA: hypothetical protein VGS96_14555 [Thermoanaerobaculia bacterium]|nr:hypothetical protein [Thermoanaerobaculia bacterium]